MSAPHSPTVRLSLSIVTLIGLCGMSYPALSDDALNMAVSPIVKANQFNAANTLLKSTEVISDSTIIEACHSIAQHMKSDSATWKQRGFHRDYEKRSLPGDNDNCATYIREQSCSQYSQERAWATLPDNASCMIIDVSRICLVVSKSFDLCRTRRIGFGDRLLRVETQDPIVLRDRNRDDFIETVMRKEGRDDP